MGNKTIHGLLRSLLADGALSEKALITLIAKAKHQKISLVTYLIQEKVTDLSFIHRLAKELCLPFIDLNTVDPLALPTHLIEEKLLKKYQVLPLWQIDEKLGLALADPTQQLAISDIRFHTGLIIEKILVDPEKLKCLLEKIIVKPKFSQKKIYPNEIINSVTSQNTLKSSDSTDTEKLKGEGFYLDQKGSDDEGTIIQTVYKILQSAIERGASDIHVEPYQDQLQIRFRIDGLLYLAVNFPIYLMWRIIARLKIMAQLDIAERRIPQDGRFQVMDANNKNINCRISTCPTLFGEKVVVRILDTNRMLLGIDELGMDTFQKNLFLEALRCPHGMVLVTGPTGSGKTITLYTALNFLNKSIVNISSVENPVEIVLPGINQVNINPKVGLNLATVLRAFLRQDPDVIMVGEMRDQETAEIGIKAAQTGHLVLSSLHTNSAAESLVRLTNMGIPAYNIASSVNLIIAQRLARRLCLHCKTKEKLPGNVLLELGLNLDTIQTMSFFSAQGCEKCTEGYRGRVGIFEMLFISNDVKTLILKGYDAREITLYAKNNGIRTLYTSALEKLKQGEISLLEMKRIIKD
jgi:type IV pilus assembly protein PilB